MSGRILIIGGSGGIGSALARRLAATGRPLHLAARDESRLQALGTAIGATWSVADAGDAASIEAAIADASTEGLDGLVYAAGTINLKPLSRLTDADFERDYTVNALGAVRAARAAAPHLAKSGKQQGPGSAAMLFFSTVAVMQGFPAHVSVSMAKGAVEGMTRALAADLAPHVRVNAIAPSLTDTPLAAALTGSEQMARALAAMHPIPRLGQADDVASLGAWLMSPDANWVTGQVMAVDGGRGALRIKG